MTSAPAETRLLQRFLASLPERLTAIGEISARLASAEERGEVVKKLGRDLHTLKGESRLLGLAEIESIAHACEDLLHSHHRAGRISEETERLLYLGLDVIFNCAESRAGGGAPDDGEVSGVVSRLRENVLGPARDAEPPLPAVAVAAEETVPVAVARTDDRVVSVPLTALDRLTDLASELSGATVRNAQLVAPLDHIAGELRRLARETMAAPSPAPSLPVSANGGNGSGRGGRLGELVEELRGVVREVRENGFRLSNTSGELTDSIRDSRLHPLREIFARYPSFVRQVAKETDRRIRMEMRGQGVAVDQRVLDAIAEPCLHLLRNAVAHGIESPAERRAAGKPEEGTVTIEAHQEGELVRVDFRDDGRGIDTDAVRQQALKLGVVSRAQDATLGPDEIARLVFTPGLTTADRAGKLAGRGVGLDVVRDVVEGMGGSCTVESTPGRGACFSLQLPVSLSLMRALLVESCDQVFAVPNAAVVDVYWVPLSEIRSIDGREATNFRGRLLPLVRLRQALGLTGIKDIFLNKVGVVVLRAADQLVGLIVDGFAGEREVVAQPFPAFLGRPAMVSGVTLTEAGQVVLILHAPDLLGRVFHAVGHAPSESTDAKEREGQRRILYVEDSFITREYATGVLRSHGYQVAEASDGLEAQELMKRQTFDLVLTDLQMPRLDGFKLTAAIRQDPATRSTPVVVLSTLDTPEARNLALAAGADTYLVKSRFSAELLIETVRQALG